MSKFRLADNDYIVMVKAKKWEEGAKDKVVIKISPQELFIRERLGKALPLSILMWRILDSGMLYELDKFRRFEELMLGMRNEVNIDNNNFYKSLCSLHENGNSLRFNHNNGQKKTLESIRAEKGGFLVEIDGHTMLIHKTDAEKCFFYDSNFGLSGFDFFDQMSKFFSWTLLEMYGGC